MSLTSLVANFFAPYWKHQEERCNADPVCRLVRRELNRVGKKFEAETYETLQDAALLSHSETIDGIEVYFNADTFTILDNGDLGICIDAQAKQQSTFWQPSYQFFKRQDGSVYYA